MKMFFLQLGHIFELGKFTVDLHLDLHFRFTFDLQSCAFLYSVASSSNPYTCNISYILVSLSFDGHVFFFNKCFLNTDL